MTDNIPETKGPEQEPAGKPKQRVVEVVEYADNRRQRAVLATLLVLLFLLLIGVSAWVANLSRPAGSAAKAQLPGGMKWVRSIYGWGKGPDQQLVAPTDVAIAPDGTIWCLSEHSKLVAFTPDGKGKKIIDPKVGTSLEGISVDENGDMYVADYGGRVIHFKPDGSIVATFGVELPNELDVHAGKIAVAAANGVAVFTPDDKVLLQMGTRGQGQDQFDLPHGIIQTSDRIYVSDTQNQRVEAFDTSGKKLWALGKAPDRSKPGAGDIRSKENSSGPFQLPTGMTLDAKGRIVVVDAFNFNISVIDPKTGEITRDSSKHKAVYGDQGNGDGYFQYPTGIAYDKSRDWFVVADTGNHRLQVVTIPDSGGNAVNRVASNVTTPMCVFLIPLLLLLIALLVAVARRRRRMIAEAQGTSAGI